MIFTQQSEGLFLFIYFQTLTKRDIIIVCLTIIVMSQGKSSRASPMESRARGSGLTYSKTEASRTMTLPPVQVILLYYEICTILCIVL